LSDAVCSSCGNPLDAKDHKLAFEHPNLFGGIDRICGKCFNKMEELFRQRLSDSGMSKKKKGV
jgi:predicted RNA-binding Zn-ribbon protein involved in translation (DUF1610 family)